MKGWIKLYRKTLENSIATDLEYLGLWSYLLLIANHKDNYAIINHKKILVKKGSKITSQLKLSENFDISLNKIHRMLKNLESWGYIEIKTTSQYTEYTIKNYGKYQGSRKQIENKQKTNRKQKETNKNDKNGKNDKKEEYPYSKIINHLNKLHEIYFNYYNPTDRSKPSKFSSKSKATRRKIRGRINEGKTIVDFKKVHKKMFSQWYMENWGRGPQREYLNPTTLYRASNFEKYLNKPYGKWRIKPDKKVTDKEKLILEINKYMDFDGLDKDFRNVEVKKKNDVWILKGENIRILKKKYGDIINIKEEK